MSYEINRPLEESTQWHSSQITEEIALNESGRHAHSFGDISGSASLLGSASNLAQSALMFAAFATSAQPLPAPQTRSTPDQAGAPRQANGLAAYSR